MNLGFGLSMIGNRRRPISAPAVSVPAWAFVARDISGSTWPARQIGGASALSLTSVGTPALTTAETWAVGVPVLDCTSGCFYADRTPWAADYGFSFAFAAGGTGTTFPIYNGQVNFSVADVSTLRMRRQSAGVIAVFAGDNTVGRSSVWGGSFASGDTIQFDRPAGAAVLLSAWLAYKEGVAQTIVTSGTVIATSDGPRLIFGGMSGLTGVITPNADNRILAVVISQSGAPFSAGDRTAVTAWIAGLKTGTLV